MSFISQNIRFIFLSFIFLYVVSCTSKGTGDDIPEIIEEEIITPLEQKLVMDVNFDNHDGDYKEYSITQANTDFNGIENVVTSNIRGLVDGINDWPQKTKVGEGNLRGHFPALMATGRKTGFLFDKGIPATEKATLEYRVKFSPDFQWKFGGKLPGFGGGTVPVGCTQDQEKINNGFTTRLMWVRNGTLNLYTYFPDRTPRCGTGTAIMRNMKPDQWYTIKQELELNTPGLYNGVVRMYVDGNLMLENNEVLFRGFQKQDVKIDRIVFHTYAGGSDTSDWWSTQDQYIYFDDFKAWVQP